jgi:hypothetical protein
LAGIVIGSVFSVFSSIFVPGMLSTAFANYSITCSEGGSFTVTSTIITSGSGRDCKGIVTIPEGITQINAWAFQAGLSTQNLDISAINLPSTLTRLENNALMELKNVTSIEIPGSVNYFGHRNLYSNKLNSVTLLGGTSTNPLKTGYVLIYGVNNGRTEFVQQKLVLGPGYIYLRQDAFQDDGFTEIVFGSGTYYVGSGSFKGSQSLQSLDFGTSTSPNVTFAISGETTAAQNPYGFAETNGNSFEGSNITSVRNCDPNPDSAFNTRLKAIKNRNNQTLFSLSTCTTTSPVITNAIPLSYPGWSTTSSVTIEGSNFRGLAGLRGVMFGSIPAASYTVNAAGTSISAVPPVSLASGTYPVSVNTFSDSSSTLPVTLVTPTIPEAPTGVSGTVANTSSVVSWSAPQSDGGSVITNYIVTASPGSRKCSTATTSCRVTGLTNGTAYTFSVVARNRAGNSPASAASASVTPTTTVPDAPTGVSGTVANASSVISWTAPGSNGGSAITGYTVTSSPAVTAPASCTNTTNLSCEFTGLTNGTTYTFSVVARNILGDSAASTASASVTAAIPPDAPTSVSGTVADAASVISWTAPGSNGGSVITNYTATSTPGSFTCTTTTTSCNVTGLTNGTAYTFKVRATNAAGNSADSTASASVTPVAPVASAPPPPPPPPPVAFLMAQVSPQITKSANTLACTSGTYSSGYTVDGVIQKGTISSFTPGSYTYNLLFNSVAQSSISVTTAKNSASWDLKLAPAGVIVTCSVTVSNDSATVTVSSFQYTAATTAAVAAQNESISLAEIDYKAAQFANSRSYQKALLDNRTIWRDGIAKSRATYYAELERIKKLSATKSRSALTATALENLAMLQNKLNSDYKVSGSASGKVRDLANKAALDAKYAAIAKANSNYYSAIESLGYGVLIP